MERKLLYCLSKISKNETIIKDKYFLINKTLSNLINVGNNINTVEPLRDFNGYSWTTISKEIESVEHNLIYQNLIILVGNEFLNKWIYNTEVMIDYMDLFTHKMEEKYGKELTKEFIENLKKISILIDAKFDNKRKEEMLKIKQEVEEKLAEIEDNESFVEKITKEKRKLVRQIKKMDETINNKSMLQEEYERRNEKLPLEEKIFSMRILSQLIANEREEKIAQLEKLNELLNPQHFVKYKKDLKEKEKYLKLLDTSNIEQDINDLKQKLQEIFLQCFETKIEKARNQAGSNKINL